MIQQLPLRPSVAFDRFATVLAGTTYVFDVRWNGRAATWFLDIRDVDGNPIRVGIAIVLGAALGGRSVDPRMPLGTLMASDLSGENRDAAFDDLGTRVPVYFYDATEVPEGAAA